MSSMINNLFICLLFIFPLLVAASVTGNKIGIYELKKGDFSIKITNYGATIISVLVPDKNGMYTFCLFYLLDGKFVELIFQMVTQLTVTSTIRFLMTY